MRMTAKHVLVTIIVVAALTFAILSSTAAAYDQAPAAAWQAAPDDPLVVVENFLTARGARDSFGATYISAPLVAIHDRQGSWVADESATRQWLRYSTDAYVVDMLVRPHADGDTVNWVERLAPRRIGYPDAPRESLVVSVDVVVERPKITSYTAPYPVAVLQPVPSGSQTVDSTPAASLPGIPPVMLFMVSALALSAGVLLVIRAARARSTAWARVSSIADAPRRIPHRQTWQSHRNRTALAVRTPAASTTKERTGS